jgi:hypothetical protein
LTSVHGTAWVQWHGETPPLSPTSYDSLYKAEFFLLITYSDGTSKRISAAGEASPRSVLQLANALLDDRTTLYSAETRSLLQSFLQAQASSN